ncbi:MAG: hypothetical protein O2967_22260 [Proteobacteria bacterium]|nr:hypothetical protein [Pseudomonadota bacterium]
MNGAVANDRFGISATTTTVFEAMGDGLRQAMETHQHSPLPLIAKCLAAALCRQERFNATIDETYGALLPRDSVDLDIAVAPRRPISSMTWCHYSSNPIPPWFDARAMPTEQDGGLSNSRARALLIQVCSESSEEVD